MFFLGIGKNQNIIYCTYTKIKDKSLRIEFMNLLNVTGAFFNPKSILKYSYNLVEGMTAVFSIFPGKTGMLKYAVTRSTTERNFSKQSSCTIEQI